MNTSEVGLRVALSRGTHRLSIYVASRQGLIEELDVRCHCIWGQFSSLFCWQAAEIPYLQRELVEGSPAVLVSFVQALIRTSKSITTRSVTKPAYSSEFPWWHLGCNISGSPLLRMDYVNLQYVKDIGFHDLYSQAAVNKMMEHILNPGDLLINNAWHWVS